MPSARQRSRSSRRAPAVMAMIGVCRSAPSCAPDRRGRLVAVQLGHLAVHQDRVVGAGVATARTAAAPLSTVSTLVAGARQHRDRDLLVDQVVLGEQQPADLAARSPARRSARRLGAAAASAACRPERDAQARAQLLAVDRLGQRRADAGLRDAAEVALLAESGHQHQARAQRRVGDDARLAAPARPCRASTGRGARRANGVAVARPRPAAPSAPPSPEAAVATVMPQSVRYVGQDAALRRVVVDDQRGHAAQVRRRARPARRRLRRVGVDADREPEGAALAELAGRRRSRRPSARRAGC